MTLKIRLVFLACGLAGYSFSVPESDCRTPDGGYGVCKQLRDCPHLNTLSQRERQQWKCGDTRLNNVCCNDCYTPDGKAGLCTPNCQHLKQMWDKSERPDYVRNSICANRHQQVCCGPPPRPVVSGQCQSQMTAFPVEVSSGCCGVEVKMQQRIVGGKDTRIEQYPWLVILEYISRYNCGGSLISGRYVLTAAHCVSGRPGKALTSVRLGEYDTSNNGVDCEAPGVCNDPPVTIPVEEVITHPEYSRQTNRHDIALIRLKYTANYTSFIRPICLPWSDVTEESPLSKLEAYAAGWGKVDNNTLRSDVKQHVKLPLVYEKACELHLRRIQKEVSKETKIRLWGEQICAGGQSGHDTCDGDSGGPLMIERISPRSNQMVYEVTGVLSFGSKVCGTPNVPGVFSKVYDYNSWIRSSIRP